MNGKRVKKILITSSSLLILFFLAIPVLSQNKGKKKDEKSKQIDKNSAEALINSIYTKAKNIEKMKDRENHSELRKEIESLKNHSRELQTLLEKQPSLKKLVKENEKYKKAKKMVFDQVVQGLKSIRKENRKYKQYLRPSSSGFHEKLEEKEYQKYREEIQQLKQKINKKGISKDVREKAKRLFDKTVSHKQLEEYVVSILKETEQNQVVRIFSRLLSNSPRKIVIKSLIHKLRNAESEERKMHLAESLAFQKRRKENPFEIPYLFTIGDIGNWSSVGRFKLSSIRKPFVKLLNAPLEKKNKIKVIKLWSYSADYPAFKKYAREKLKKPNRNPQITSAIIFSLITSIGQNPKNTEGLVELVLNITKSNKLSPMIKNEILSNTHLVRNEKLLRNSFLPLLVQSIKEPKTKKVLQSALRALTSTYVTDKNNKRLLLVEKNTEVLRLYLSRLPEREVHAYVSNQFVSQLKNNTRESILNDNEFVRLLLKRLVDAFKKFKNLETRARVFAAIKQFESFDEYHNLLDDLLVNLLNMNTEFSKNIKEVRKRIHDQKHGK